MNEEKPVVSLIVSIYNAEKFLHKCVDSILRQSYDNIEVILVNDGSKDNSKTICEEYGKLDSRVLVVSKENGGLTSARKAGYEKATGEYIAFLDSDDYLEKDYVRLQVKNIRKHNGDISICSYYVEKDYQMESVRLLCSHDIYLPEDYVRELILPRIYFLDGDQTCIPDFLWLRLLKKELISDNCFVSEREVYTEDIFFHLEYLKNCKKICILNQSLYHYIVHTNSLTHIHRHGRFQMESNRLKLLKQYLNYYKIEDKKRIVSATYRAIWGCIDNAFYSGNYKEFKKELKETYSDKEFQGDVKKIEKKSLSLKDRIILLAYKFHCYRLLYNYKSR